MTSWLPVGVPSNPCRGSPPFFSPTVFSFVPGVHFVPRASTLAHIGSIFTPAASDRFSGERPATRSVIVIDATSFLSLRTDRIWSSSCIAYQAVALMNTSPLQDGSILDIVCLSISTALQERPVVHT